MAKKKFISPFVLLLEDEGDASDIGGGSAQSGFKPYPCSFDDWRNLFGVDYNGDGIDFQDYTEWWAKNDFSDEDWKRFNPGSGDGAGSNFIELYPGL